VEFDFHIEEPIGNIGARPNGRGTARQHSVP
jgi:hypothetical protein